MSFTRVYTDESFGNNFFAVDVVQTADSGYLVLGEYENENVEYRFSPYVLKVDALGAVEWDLKLDDPYQKPVKGLQVSDTAVTFFCMSNANQTTYRMSVNLDARSVTEIENIGSVTFPLASAPLSSGGFVLLGFDINDSKSVVYQRGEGGTWTAEFLNIEDADDIVVPHLNRTGPQLPFFTGTFDGGIYFNGLSNFGFGMRFLDNGGNDLGGSLSGFRYSTGLSAAVHISGNNFALARYDDNQNYLMPLQQVDVGADETTNRLGGLEIPQMKDKAVTEVQVVDILGQPTVLYGTSTRDNRIMLTGYDANTGLLLGTKYFGNGNPYDMVAARSTGDGGLILVSNTYVTGRFPRIALFKISESQASDIIY